MKHKHEKIEMPKSKSDLHSIEGNAESLHQQLCGATTMSASSAKYSKR